MTAHIPLKTPDKLAEEHQPDLPGLRPEFMATMRTWIVAAVEADRAQHPGHEQIVTELARHHSGPNGCKCGDAPDMFWEREMREHVADCILALGREDS